MRIVIQNREGNQAQIDSIDVIGSLHAIKEKETNLNGLSDESTRAQESPAAKITDFYQNVKNELNNVFIKEASGECGYALLRDPAVREYFETLPQSQSA